MSFLTDNLKLFTGCGLSVVLFLGGLLFLGIKLKKSATRTMMVWFPVFALMIFACPIWILYNKIRDDGAILYRLMWMSPISLVVGYAIIEIITMLPKKYKTVSFVGAILVIMLCGKYVYSNPMFSKAENAYHVPETVAKICDELKVEGREIRVCMPIEFIQYTKQYSPYICLTYGRYVLYGMPDAPNSKVKDILEKDVIDAEALCEELRATKSPYLVIGKDKAFSESLANFDVFYCTSIDGYDIYLDSKSRLAEFLAQENN